MGYRPLHCIANAKLLIFADPTPSIPGPRASSADLLRRQKCAKRQREPQTQPLVSTGTSRARVPGPGIDKGDRAPILYGLQNRSARKTPFGRRHAKSKTREVSQATRSSVREAHTSVDCVSGTISRTVFLGQIATKHLGKIPLEADVSLRELEAVLQDSTDIVLTEEASNARSTQQCSCVMIRRKQPRPWSWAAGPSSRS